MCYKKGSASDNIYNIVGKEITVIKSEGRIRKVHKKNMKYDNADFPSTHVEAYFNRAIGNARNTPVDLPNLVPQVDEVF